MMRLPALEPLLRGIRQWKFTKAYIRSLVTTVVLLTCRSLANGQAITGTPAFSAIDSHAYDDIDPMSNTIILHASVMSKAGTLPFNLTLYANSGMSTRLNGTTTYWDMLMYKGNAFGFLAPGAPFARAVNDIFLEDVRTNTLAYYTVKTVTTCNGASTDKFSGWVISTGRGTIHKLDPALYYNDTSGGDCVSSFTGTAIDGSGWTLTATYGHNPAVYNKNGLLITPAWAGAPGQETDRNGNIVSALATGSVGKYNTIYTDSMGQPIVTWSDPNNTSGPNSFTWTDVSQGVTNPTVTQTYSSLKWQTAFNCGSGFPLDTSSPGTLQFETGITLADGRTLGIGYESQAANTVTGRVSTITLPEGGTITYTYSGGSNGLNCTYQTPPLLTRTLSNGDTTTYSLAYSQIGATANYRAINSVSDPGGNETDYRFTGFTSTGVSSSNAQVLTWVIHWSGNSSGNNRLRQEQYCYNNTFANCVNVLNGTFLPDQVYTLPITSRIVFSQIQGKSTWSAVEDHYDQYGNVTYHAMYDYGVTTGSVPTNAVTTTYGTWNGTQCVGLTNTHVKDTPCEVIGTVTGSVMSDARYIYDANGNLLKSIFQQDTSNANSWTGQTVSNVYNPNGTISKSYDMNNNETDYEYSPAGYLQCTGCTQYPFPTKITNAGTGNYTNYTYYGQGGVVATATDRNGVGTTYSYSDRSGNNDPYWRPLQITNPLGAITEKTYPKASSPTLATNWMNVGLNGGNSIVGGASTVDSLGRVIDIQAPQQPGGSTYDTASAAYSWNGTLQRVTTNTVPCSATLSAPCSMQFTQDRDPLGRMVQTSHGTGYETTTYTYSGLDTLTQVSPASPGENIKQHLNEYDGLGRVTISCDVGGVGSNSCGTSNLSYSGVATTFQYGQVHPPGGPNQTYVHSDRNDGTHDQGVYHAFDGLGRLVDIQPSYGPLLLYYFDIDGGNCPGYMKNVGRLVCSKDGIYQTIYFYDSEGRLTDTGTSLSGTGTTTFCRRFRYDNTTGILGSIPTGVTLSNQYGRLAEAETDDCTWPVTAAHQITDEWFAYDAAGNVTDTWQMSPHSTQYYHSHATFFENGAPKTVQLANPAFYTMTFGIDGEARLYSLADTTHSKTIVNSATYFPVANPARTTIYGSDSDAFTYDTVSGNMTQYQYTVNGVNYIGALTWNPNGSLRKLATTDGFNSAGTQTCYFNPSDASSTGYNDFGQLVGFDCGGTNWGQTFSYDPFDNITKSKISGRTGTSWAPGYNPSNNHYNVGTYDANGDVTSDGNFNYGWNEIGKMKWAAPSGTPTCGTSGRCITYDALGRIVETSNGSTWTERWYTQAGWASMSGTTINFAYWPAPHGAKLLENANGGTYFFMHPDWVGSTRLISSATHGISGDIQYSPYGEVTAQFGSPINGLFQFAGMTENFYKGAMFDADNRELSTSAARWLSPDPAHAGWNQYAYSTNPNSNIDPSGLEDLPYCPVEDFCMGPGPGCDPDFGCDPGCDPDFGCGGPILPPPSGPPGGTPPSNPPGGTPPSNPPSSNPPSETTPGGNYTGPFWQEWGNVPPWMAGGWGLPSDCSSDFGAPCNDPMGWQNGAANDQSIWGYLASKPWVVSWILPVAGPVPGVIGAGPAGGVAWNPKTHNLCIGFGLGASAGHNAAIGPLLASSGDVDSILSGWSVSGGGNLPFPSPAAGLGWQVIANSSGVAQGPTAGIAGLSGAVTWSKCANLW